MVNATLGNVEIGFEYLKKWMMFSSPIVFFNLTRKIQIDGKKIFSFMKCLGILLSCITIYQYIAGGNQNYVYNGVLTPDLKFNFENSNKTALFLTPLFFMIIACLLKAKYVIERIILFAFSVFMLFFIMETSSRNCILSIVFGIFLFFYLLLARRKKFFLIESIFFSAIPFIYAIFYLIVVNNPIFIDMFSFIAGEGKPLNSRDYIWNLSLDYFFKSPIVGAYNEVFSGQLHNTHIDILVSYGFESFVLFIIFITCILNRIEMKRKDQKLYVSMFLALLFCGSGEAALYCGCVGLYISVGSFLLLSYSSNYKNNI